MKIYILADMEGISGIRKMDQVMLDSKEYPHGCELMMQDINVAVRAALDAGADEVVACDTHGGGGQVRLDVMDGRAIYELPCCDRMMPSLDETFSGVILLGHHARAGTLDGFLDHTMSSTSCFEFRINDQVVGEVGIEAAYAGHFNVPVIAVTGDEAVAEEARALLGSVECAVVKWGIGRNRARCLSMSESHGRIQQTVEKAVRSVGRFVPWRPKLPATLQLTFYRSDMTEMPAIRPGVERVDARTLRTSVSALKNVMTWLS
ncbi:MAG: M55 family metallopeptidase [Phycisphaerae bacterium]